MKSAANSKKRKHSDFYRHRRKAGLWRQEDAEKFFEVCGRTIRNWGEKGAQPMAMRLLQYRDKWEHCGNHMGPEWAGWRFSGGKLINARKKLRFGPQTLGLWPSICRELSRHESEATRRRRCPLLPAAAPVGACGAVRQKLTYTRKGRGTPAFPCPAASRHPTG